MTDLLIIPPDVLLLPATQLPARVRTQIDYEVGDYAIMRPGARSYAKIVDVQSAELVASFREPKTIPEAVISYSLPRNLFPERTLEDAFALLQDLMKSRLLVPADSIDAQRIEPSLQPDFVVDGYTIRRVVQSLSDSELFQVECADGQMGALKIVRSAADNRQSWQITRETEILHYLNGRVNPALLGTGTYEGRTYLVTEWIEGKNAVRAAHDMRCLEEAVQRQGLLELCCQIVDAYIALHDQDVIHGDIHPRNILLSDEGKIKLIDFGLSRISTRSGALGFAVRGGVNFFFEPEYAAACLGGTQPPHTSFPGEQYSLAALVYLLMTGSDYADFSYEQTSLLEQIITDSPLPFYKRGVKSWPAVEEVLVKALSKVPAERYASVSEFGAKLKQLVANSVPDVVNVSAGSELLPDVLARLDIDSSFFATGIVNAPMCSVTYGAAGIAYSLYRMSVVRQDPRLLALADLWSTRALHQMEQPTAFYHSRYEVNPETVGRTSPYHTASGVFCVQALIAQALGEQATLQSAIAAFVEASKAPCHNLDLTLGKSGTLAGCCLLLSAAANCEEATVNRLRDLGIRTCRQIWSQIDALGSIQEQGEIDYLGIAHGWAGILYATLWWHRASGMTLPSNVSKRLNQLSACTESWHDGARWPAILNKPIYMTGWCNGSAGFVYLWTLAYEVLRDSNYSELAIQAGRHAWQEPDTLPTLCCGLAGRSYALLKLYKHTSNPIWLVRARTLAERAAGSIPSNKDLANSLYKGEVGTATLLVDLEHPETACLPFFEDEGW